VTRILIVVGLSAAIVGCGSSSPDREASMPSVTTPTQENAPTPTQESAPNRRLAALPGPCARGARGAIPGGVTRVEPFNPPSGAVACRIEGSSLTAIAMIDSAPQPYQRLEREVVEYGQNVEWTKVPASAFPRSIKGLGLDAHWFPLQSRLLTTDGVRLITIKLHAHSIGPTERKAIATRLARVYLGPLHKPPGY
jgi:hypothetical protein